MTSFKQPRVTNFTVTDSNEGDSYVRRHAKASSVGSTHGTGRARRAPFGLACLCVLGLMAFLGSSASTAAADEACPNEALRGQSNVNPTTSQPYSAGLPECRAYEMVSPLEKQAHDVQLPTSAPVLATGDRIAFAGAGAFAGAENFDGLINAYMASRSPTAGWSTTSSMLPARLAPVAGSPSITNNLEYSSDLSTVAQCALDGDNSTAPGISFVCALRDASGDWTSAKFPGHAKLPGAVNSPNFQLVGASADLSHLVVRGFGATSALVPEDTSLSESQLYDITGLGGPSPEVHLVAVDNTGASITSHQGSLVTPSFLGGTSGNATDTVSHDDTLYRAVSQDGATIYFTATPAGGVPTLYARLDNATTVAISDPDPAECTTCDPTPQPPVYQGASADGDKAFFLTTQQLVNADTDATRDLYEYDFDAPNAHHLVQVSGGGAGDPTPGSDAAVQGVVRLAADSSRVSFVATGVLTTLPNSSGESAAPGADNLYVYDLASGRTAFVGQLCSGAGVSGSVSDTLCPGSRSDAGIWALADQLRQAHSTPDGRYLIFSTAAQLVHSGPQADTDEATDIYRYDIVTGQLTRISVGGSSALTPAAQTGNTPGMNAMIGTNNNGAGSGKAAVDGSVREISDDGSSVLFVTPEALQGDDVNGGSPASTCFFGNPNALFAGCDVYLWHDGVVRLISDGQNPAGANLSSVSSSRIVSAPTMTPSGSDVYFTTRAALVPTDTDELADIYDARVDGGIAYLPPPACVLGSCQGSAQNALPFATPTSSTFTGPGNAAPPSTKKKKHHKKKHHKKKHHKKKHHKKKGSPDVSVGHVSS